MQELQKEQEFLRLIQTARKEAGENGNMISAERIKELFESLELSDEQMNQVDAYLKTSGVTVGDAPEGGAQDADGGLSQEEHDYLEDYLEMLREIPQPSSGQLEAMKLSAMAGELSAQKELAQVMLSHVVDIAKLYTGQGVLLEDLIGCGNEALVRGVKLLAPLEDASEVDGALGRRIMDAMEDLIAQYLDERSADLEIEEKVNFVADKAAELARLAGRKITPEELAHEGEVSMEQILEAMHYSANAIEDIDLSGSELKE